MGNKNTIILFDDIGIIKMNSIYIWTEWTIEELEIVD